MSEQRKSLPNTEVKHVSPGSGSRSPFTSPGSSNHSPPSAQKQVATLLDYTGVNSGNPQPRAKTPTGMGKAQSAAEERSLNSIINETLGLSVGSFIEPKLPASGSNIKSPVGPQPVSSALNLSQSNSSLSQRKKDSMDNDDFFSMFEQFVRKDLGAENDLLSPSKKPESNTEQSSLSKTETLKVQSSKPNLTHSYDKILGTTDVSKALKAALFDKPSEKTATSVPEGEVSHKSSYSVNISKASVSNVDSNTALNLSTSLPKTNSKPIITPSVSKTTVTSLSGPKMQGTSEHFPPFSAPQKSGEVKLSSSGTKPSKSPAPKTNTKMTPILGSNPNISSSTMLYQSAGSANMNKQMKGDASSSGEHIPEIKGQSVSSLPKQKVTQHMVSVTKSHSTEKVQKSINSSQKPQPDFSSSVRTPTAKTVPTSSFSPEKSSPLTLSSSQLQQYQAMLAKSSLVYKQQQQQKQSVTKKPEAKKAFEAPSAVKHKNPSPLLLGRQSQTSSSQPQHTASNSHSVVKPVTQRHPVSPKITSGRSSWILWVNRVCSDAKKCQLPSSQKKIFIVGIYLKIISFQDPVHLCMHPTLVCLLYNSIRLC